MDVTVCELQVVALAVTVKGDDTEAPLAGLLMATFEADCTGCVGCEGCEGCEGVVDEAVELAPPPQPAAITTGTIVIKNKEFRRRFIQGPFRIAIPPIRSGPGFVIGGKVIAAREDKSLLLPEHCRVAF